MKVFVLDSEPDIVAMIVAALAATGHAARGFTRSADLLSALTPDVDLVLADAMLNERDGFALAEQVAARVGNCPPRTVLMSTDTHNARLRAAPVKSVLGIIAEPFVLAEFHKIIAIMAATRKSCPCRIKGLIACPETRANAESTVPGTVRRYCDGASYTDCPEFETLCGARLREWISRDKH